MNDLQATAIILAGGKSSRMGTNKALLPLNGKTNIQIIKDALQPYFSQLLLVTNDFPTYEFLNLPMVRDEYKEKGPIGGIHAGLKHSQSNINFVVACDMPFISGLFAKYLTEQCDSYDAVVPVIYGKTHPLFAVYKKAVFPIAEKNIKDNQLKMVHLLKMLNVHYIKETDLSSELVGNFEKLFYNMNNPTDYEQAKKWLE